MLGARVSVVCAVAAAVSLVPSVANAATRSGSVSDPAEGLGPNRDIVSLQASYQQESGRVEATVGFQDPVATSGRQVLHVYFRTNRDGACGAGPDDIELRSLTDPADVGGPYSGSVMSRELPTGANGAPGSKTVSADARQITLYASDARLANLDEQCVVAVVTDVYTIDRSYVPPVQDATPPLYFAGFGPPAPAPTVPAPTTPTAPVTPAAPALAKARLSASSVSAALTLPTASVVKATVMVGRRSLAASSTTAQAGAATVRVKLSRSAKAKLRKARRGTLKVTVIPAQGTPTKLSAPIQAR